MSLWVWFKDCRLIPSPFMITPWYFSIYEYSMILFFPCFSSFSTWEGVQSRHDPLEITSEPPNFMNNLQAPRNNFCVSWGFLGIRRLGGHCGLWRHYPSLALTVLKTIQLSWDKTLLNISSAPILLHSADLKIYRVFQNTRSQDIQDVPKYQISRYTVCSRIPDLKIYMMFQSTRSQDIQDDPKYQISRYTGCSNILDLKI